jgi:hypothetical protein
VLLQATCERCREITRAFEGECQTGMFGPARARLDLNRKDRAKPDRKAQVRYRDGRQEERLIGKEYIPAAMVIPDMPTAAIFLGLNWRPGPIKLQQIVFSDDARRRDPDIHQVAVEIPINLVSFSRMLSKIALGVAHYRLGPDAFSPLGLEFLREGIGHPNHFVGGFAEATGAPEAPSTLHNISLWHRDGLLVVTVQLFAAANAPVNYAVVGRLRHMPPGLPPLHLGPPTSRQSRTPDPLTTDQPTTEIQWDQIAPSSHASASPKTI